MNIKFISKKQLGIIAACFFCVALSTYILIDKFYTSQILSKKQDIITAGCDLLYPNLQCHLIESDSIKIWIPEEYENSLYVYLNKQKISFYKPGENDFDNEINSVEINKNNHFLAFEIPLEIGKHSIDIVAPSNKSKRTISINKTPKPAWLTEYKSNKKANQLDNTIEKLIAASSAVKGTEKALLHYHLGRAYLSIDDIQKAITQLKLSNKLFRQHNITNKIIDNSTVLVYIYLYLQDNPTKSEQILANLPSEKNDAKSLFYKNFYSGQLSSYLGALQDAESYFHQARNTARSYNLRKEYLDSEFMYTQILIYSGQTKRAVNIRKKLLTQIPHLWSDCRISKYYNGLGWAQIKSLESSPLDSTSITDNPFPALNYALELLGKSCPRSTHDKITIFLNLGKAYYLKGQIREARTQLLNIDKIKIKLTYRQKLEFIELKGLLALHSRNAEESIRHFESLLDLATKVKYSEFVIDALVGKAKAFEIMKLYDDALESYNKAERLIFEEFINIPMTSSQPYFLSSKMNFSYSYVDLLNRLNRTEEAMMVARRFRARWVDSIHRVRQHSFSKVFQQEEWNKIVGQIRKLRKSIIAQQSLEWSIPYDQIKNAKRKLEEEKLALSNLFDKSIRLVNKTIGNEESAQTKPKENELFLFFYATNDSLIGFASTQNDLRSHTIPFKKALGFKPTSLAKEWITVFEKEIERSKKIKIFPFGLMKQVDFQTLPYKGDILLAHKTISYGVDLKIHTLNKIETPKTFRSLIVANSLGDLKETENEARSVAQLTRESDWISRTLTANQVVFDSMKDQLEKAQHFHYAGHVNRTENEVFRHHIPLSDNAEMDSTDILMLQQVPAWVVLSACNSALNNKNITTQSIGLAHAFIIAGSKKVIATVRPVLDKQANHIMQKFYEQWMKSDNFEQAFRITQLNLLKTQPQYDWAAFRLVTL